MENPTDWIFGVREIIILYKNEFTNDITGGRKEKDPLPFELSYKSMGHMVAVTKRFIVGMTATAKGRYLVLAAFISLSIFYQNISIY